MRAQDLHYNETLSIDSSMNTSFKNNNQQRPSDLGFIDKQVHKHRS